MMQGRNVLLLHKEESDDEEGLMMPAVSDSAMYFSIVLVLWPDREYTWPLDEEVPERRLMVQSKGQWCGTVEPQALLKTFLKSTQEKPLKELESLKAETETERETRQTWDLEHDDVATNPRLHEQHHHHPLHQVLQDE